LLHLHHGFLLRHLRLIGLLQYLADPLLGLEVFRNAAVGAAHFAQGEIGIVMLARSALGKTRRGNLVEQILWVVVTKTKSGSQSNLL
jgi:hypothetical protein